MASNLRNKVILVAFGLLTLVMVGGTALAAIHESQARFCKPTANCVRAGQVCDTCGDTCGYIGGQLRCLL